MNSLYQSLSNINRIKRRELVLPIAKKEVVISPLSVGDDISLKTAIVSPVRLDAEIMKLLWSHTDFWKSEEDVIKDNMKINSGTNSIISWLWKVCFIWYLQRQVLQDIHVCRFRI